MKAFLLLILTVALVNCGEHDHHAHHEHHDHAHHDNYVVKTHEDLVKYRDICAERVHATADDIAKYKKWEYPEDDKSRCFLKCIFEHFGFFDDHNGFDVHKIHHQLAAGNTVDHNDATHQKIADCADKNTQGSDACTWAHRGGMCFMRSNLQLVQHSVHA